MATREWASLAAYIATSARRSRSTMRAPSSRSATPALASTSRRAPSMTKGSVIRSRISAAITRPSSPAASVAEDGELVTPEPHEQVVLGRPGGEAPRDLAEQLVARRMAEGVVDLLEVVEVDQDQREPICGVRGLEALRAMLEERAPVPEPGEVVGDRLATSVGEALHLPETDERPRDGEQQREGRQRHHDRVLGHGEEREDPDRGEGRQHRDREQRPRSGGADRAGPPRDQIATAMQVMPVIQRTCSQGPTA